MTEIACQLMSTAADKGAASNIESRSINQSNHHSGVSTIGVRRGTQIGSARNSPGMSEGATVVQEPQYSQGHALRRPMRFGRDCRVSHLRTAHFESVDDRDLMVGWEVTSTHLESGGLSSS